MIELGILDVRPSPEYYFCHLGNSTSIPIEELESRQNELPPRGSPLELVVTHDDEPMKQKALSILSKYYDISRIFTLRNNSNESKRLWRPSHLLEDHLSVIKNNLDPCSSLLFGLDIACGSGRDLVYLLKEFDNMKMIGLDVQQNLLDKLTQFATKEHIKEDRFGTKAIDLETDLSVATDIFHQEGWIGKFDLICQGRYLHRPLFPLIKEALKKGGLFVGYTFMEPSLGRPKNPKHILQAGEFKEIFHDDFEVIEYIETTLPDKRPFQFIVCKKCS